MLIFCPDWGLGGGFITVQNKNREILEQHCALFLFCCEIPSLQHSSVFLPMQENHFLFQMGQTVRFICYPTLWALQNCTNPGSGRAKLHRPTLRKQTAGGGKVERNLLLLFKWCSHSLLPHGAQEGVETCFYTPSSPPFPASSPKSCSCVPLSKEAVILGRLHVSYTGQGEVITSSSHTAQSCQVRTRLCKTFPNICNIAYYISFPIK